MIGDRAHASFMRSWTWFPLRRRMAGRDTRHGGARSAGISASTVCSVGSSAAGAEGRARSVRSPDEAHDEAPDAALHDGAIVGMSAPSAQSALITPQWHKTATHASGRAWSTLFIAAMDSCSECVSPHSRLPRSCVRLNASHRSERSPPSIGGPPFMSTVMLLE